MIVKTQTSAHDALEDPLSGSTRSTKRSLVVFSSIAMLIVLTGIRPEEVSVFGLKFPGLTLPIFNGALLILLFLNICTFLVYGLSDYFRFKHRLDVYNFCRASDADEAIHTDRSSYEAQHQEHLKQEFLQMTGYRPFEIQHRPTKTLVVVRISLDLVAPFLFGVISFALYLFMHVLQ
jgi:hypothetical protein